MLAEIAGLDTLPGQFSLTGKAHSRVFFPTWNVVIGTHFHKPIKEGWNYWHFQNWSYFTDNPWIIIPASLRRLYQQDPRKENRPSLWWCRHRASFRSSSCWKWVVEDEPSLGCQIHCSPLRSHTWINERNSSSHAEDLLGWIDQLI